MKEVSVIISGGGSVGLPLAAELGWRGIKCMILEQREADLKRRDLEFQTKLVQYEALSKEKKIKQQKLTQRLEEEERKCQKLDSEATNFKESLREKHQQLKTPEV